MQGVESLLRGICALRVITQQSGMWGSVAIARLPAVNLGTVDIWGWVTLLCGAELYIVGWLAASLAFAHWIPVATPQL